MLKGIVSGSPVDITRIAMKGKNLLKPKNQTKTVFGVSVTVTNNLITLSGPASGSGGRTNDLSDNFTLKAGTYTIRTKPTGLFQPVINRRSDHTAFVDTFTLNEDTVVYFGINVYNRTYNGESARVALVSGSSYPSSYEPYGMQPGWEVRDQQGTILWGADKTLTGTDSISFKGYGLPLKSYEIEANMEQAASQQYSISGTDSVTYQSDGTSIALQIVGNETQTGTPTPTVPITPQECGDRTANLFDTTTVTQDVFVRAGNTSESKPLGNIEPNTSYSISDYIPVSAGMQYTVQYPLYGSASGAGIVFYSDNAGTAVAGIPLSQQSETYTFAIPSGCSYLRLSYLNGNGNGVILNEGTVASGYKIPITNGNTTYNIYLSEPLRKIGDYGDSVSSDGTVTRRIKKLVLTGQETANVFSGSSVAFMIAKPSDMKRSERFGLCSHFLYQYSPGGSTKDGITFGDAFYFTFSNNTASALGIVANDIESFKTFLASEYSAGHPVEVWYVLATPVSDTATFPTITPTQGSNTLSVNTTLAPSAITLTATSAVWPGNPIQPEECGEPTVNLLDEQAYFINRAVLQETSNYVVTINAKPNTSYTLSTNIPYTPYEGNMVAQLFLSSGTYVGPTTGLNGAGDGIPRTITTDSTGLLYVITRGPESVIAPISYTQYLTNGYWMNLVEGSTALPYEPYGKYKLPITLAGTTQNVYLDAPLRKIGTYADKLNADGTVTRRIKKVVFTGQETWTEVYPGEPEAQAQGIVMYATSLSEIGMDRNDFICSHFFVGNYRGYLISGQGRINGTSPEAFNVNYNNGSGGLQNFKTWLASEYASGHPVEVWYVLATATTETVTAPEIATTAGTNTLTIDTTLAPSETTITGHIKPIST